MEIVCVYESNVILTQTDECPRACASVRACVCVEQEGDENGVAADYDALYISVRNSCTSIWYAY